MRFDKRVVAANLALVASVVLWASHAAGLTLTAHTEGQVLGISRSDSQGPAGSGSLLSTVHFPEAVGIGLLSEAYAQSAMNDSGSGAVLADGAIWQRGSELLRAEATWSETATNTSRSTLLYNYNFTLTPPKLTLVDVPGLPGGSASQAEYDIVIELNNAQIFRSNAVLSGTLLTHTLTKLGTDLGGQLFSTAHGLGYNFKPLTAVLPLGLFPPGQGFTITARLIAIARSSAPGRGGRAEIGDPLAIDGEPGFSGSITMDMPLAVESKSWSAVKDLYRK